MSLMQINKTSSRGRLLLTGCRGLIGMAARPQLQALGFEVVGMDLRGVGPECGDTRDVKQMADALQGVCGVIHLAAVSRVVHGERNPELCWATNVTALSGLIDQLEQHPLRPWLLFASSREVYGHNDGGSVAEDAALRPVNVYGRSKLEGELRVDAARERGLHTQIVRFSNVYGSTADHADRVVPAFARRSSLGQPLRIDGGANTFDFTHVSDAAAGLVALVQQMVLPTPRPLPAVHFVTGVPTSLQGLADLAVRLSGGQSSVVEAPSRDFDVAHFHGNPLRAKELLGWSAKVSIQQGLKQLIADFSALDVRQDAR